MQASTELRHDDCTLSGPIPEEAVLIIGAGRFGKRASRLLADKSLTPLLIVDRDKKRLREIKGAFMERIPCDGGLFLSRNFHLIHSSNWIIPAVPIHLACTWLENHLANGPGTRRIPVPAGLGPCFPNTWEGSEGSLLVSYANFMCPDDCPEPENTCTVTGEKRDAAMFELIGRIRTRDFRVHVIQSRQIAPGLGGYETEELSRLLDRVKEGGKGKWLIGTACRCHGTITALEII